MKLVQRYVIAALVILLAAAAGTIWYLNFRYNNYREAAVAASLALENTYAMAAETYEYAGQWRQRAQQLTLERDSLARSLDERPVVETVVYVDPAPDTIVAEPVVTDDVIIMNFEDAVLSVEVEYRPVDLTSTMVYNIKPMVFEFGVRCGPPNQIGVRPVLVTLENELPMDADVQRAVVDPEVCNAKVLEGDGGGGFGWKSAALGVLLGFVAGAIS